MDDNINLVITPRNRIDLSKSLNFNIVAGDDLDNNIFISNFKLDNPYPNPFNPIINIDFQLSKLSFVKISIYDSKGTLVDKVEENFVNPGSHSYNWNASKFSSGSYYIEIIANEHKESRIITLIK